MAAKDLITSTRAKDALGAAAIGGSNLTLSADETTTLGDLVTAVSDAIEKWCKRRFYAHAFDELYHGSGDRRLLLREYPVQLVTSVRYWPVTFLKISNTDATNAQARVTITSTGLSLYRFTTGAGVTDTSVTWATYPTISQVATAVNALGHGWSAVVVNNLGGGQNAGLYPSADLYLPPSFGDGTVSRGGLSCAAGAVVELKIHAYELQGYDFDPKGWIIRVVPYTDPDLLHPEDLVFPPGLNNFRVQYTAGYTTIPEAVQEACAQWVAMIFWQTKRDPLLLSQIPSGGTMQGWATQGMAPDEPPLNVRALLASYRRHSVGFNMG